MAVIMLTAVTPAYAQQAQTPSDGIKNAAIMIGGLAVTNKTLEITGALFQDVPIIGGLLKESQKAIAAVMRKRFFDMVVDQMVNWIQGGGQPQFIQNWDSFLASYGNIVTGDLVQQLGLGAVCRPFGIQLQIAVMQPPRFTRQITCTLDQMVGNMVNFYNNFRAGGFIAYRELWQPQNNFYGSLIMTMNEKETRIADQRFAALQEAQANNGFLGTRKCDAYGHCYITTPGMQIGAAAAKVVGADLDYIIGIPQEDLAAYTAAISDAFINRLVRNGVQGLQGVVVANVPPIGYIPTQPKGYEPCAGLTGNALSACRGLQATQTNNSGHAREVYLAQIIATLAPLQDAQQNILELIPVQNQLTNKLNVLRDCEGRRNLPGLEQTSGSVRVEEKTLADLNQTLLGLQQTTIPLVNAKTKLADESADIAVITGVISTVYPFLNEQKATAYQAAIKTQRDTLTPAINERLKQTQIAINQCGG